MRSSDVFYHRKPKAQLHWQPDEYIIKANTPKFKKFGGEDGFDKNFTDILLFRVYTDLI
jgi:hypothetical protein